MGAASVVLVGRESSRKRLEIGATLGATETICVGGAEDLDAVLVDRVDMAFEAAGSPVALLSAIKSARAGGRVLSFGGFSKPLSLDYQTHARSREVDLLASRGRTSDDWRVLMAMVAGRTLDFEGLPKQVFPLQDIERALEVAVVKSTVKVLLDCAA